MYIERLKTSIIAFSLLGSILLFIMLMIIWRRPEPSSSPSATATPIPLPSPLSGYSSDPDLVVFNHTTPGATWHASSVHLQQPGFLVVWKKDREEKKYPIGKSHMLSAGDHKDITITLTEQTKPADHIIVELVSTDEKTTYFSTYTVIEEEES